MKKYSPIGELSAFARQYAESLAHVSGCLAFICDMDQVIAAAGSGKKEVEEQYISKPLEKVLEARRAQCASSDDKKYVKVLAEQEENYSWEIIQPILCEGDVIGGVVLLLKEGKKKFSQTEERLATCAADFLGRQMES